MKTHKLFIPDPTHVTSDILEAMSKSQIGHRTPEISRIIEEITEGVKDLLYTKNKVLLMSNPASAMWEMGTKNSVIKGLLHTVNGAFSKKWLDISNQYDFHTNFIEYSWGKAIKIDDIDKLLSTGKFDTFAMVHNETSTGVMNNLEEISNLLLDKYPDIIWLVDSVSSMAGTKIEVDKLGIDYIFSSTQKAWGLPAGFSVCAFSDKIYQKSKNISGLGYYFNLQSYNKSIKKNQTLTTPSIPHLYGLKFILEKIKEEGLKNRWNRHIAMAKKTREWALNHGQKLFPEEGYESNTLTCIDNLKDWDINYINEKFLERGFRMDRGYGLLRTKAFRISHMGNIYMNDLVEYLEIFDEIIKDLTR